MQRMLKTPHRVSVILRFQEWPGPDGRMDNLKVCNPGCYWLRGTTTKDRVDDIISSCEGIIASSCVLAFPHKVAQVSLKFHGESVNFEMYSFIIPETLCLFDKQCSFFNSKQ